MLMDNLKYVGISTSGSQTVTTVFHEIYLLFKKKKGLVFIVNKDK